MTSRTAWTAGNGQGLTWGTSINSSDMAGLATGSTVLSSVTDVNNGSNLDIFMDLSVRCAIASSTVTAGANLGIWLYPLLDNNSTYGDGQFTAGTGAAKTPTFPPLAIIPLVAASTQTILAGAALELVIPPGSFRLAIQNNSGFSLTTATQTVMYRTYNTNLNN